MATYSRAEGRSPVRRTNVLVLAWVLLAGALYLSARQGVAIARVELEESGGVAEREEAN